ncbi:tRNA (N6-isopentenyl adenosine(37)-C2)-methylthiotransferase MiaB [Limnochorda pilosa]|uniref:tRNA-2-methylthio-N(6)-dimethylallyladenosine synthase n=1 Tax=Limnochorda pilosa TaxID=1555112 RepID=A0A0K2SKD0_LIMPI|nr:tRNA (N6-isopentenyl adenosine(37)-C2)-methylthiotransferase MiaB [Limnochorda pilosa]BAS27573.1 (dimethylallyl)adenosine tRNA methylthiotransferase [Limnochorda pilosa]
MAEAVNGAGKGPSANGFGTLPAATSREAAPATFLGRGRKAQVVTFGCQMNERDSETMRGLLTRMGYALTDETGEADLILFNTCSVRENPERKVYGRVGLLRELKARKPWLKIGICGCMPQQRAEQRRIEETLPHVDLVFGTMNLHRLPELLQRVEETGERVIEVWHEEGDVVEGLPVQRLNGFKAFVTIIYGCNEHCTYCIVPTTRGRERSRRPEAILDEIQTLADQGYREVTLLGQTADAYGRDLGDVDLAGLLYQVNRIRGIRRIRFTTSHPKHVTPRLIRALAENEKVCEHLHLPVQAGSNRTLKRMGRHYTREGYLELVERIRRGVPGIALTTDLIVGFPGETEEDFQETLSLVEEVRFDGAFTFIYSPRIGTAATRFPAEQWVPAEVAKDRIYRLIDLQNRISLEKNRELVGQELEVLVEGASEKEPGKLTGRTRSNRIVVFEGDASLVGRLVRVRVTGAQTFTLEGEPVRRGLATAAV